MGIFRQLLFGQAHEHLKRHYDLELIDLKATKNGVSDSVYTVQTNGGGFVLKIFEFATPRQIECEHSLLRRLESIKVMQPFNHGHIPMLLDRPSALYRLIEGSHPQKTTPSHAQEIGSFLSRMHAVTHGMDSENPSFSSLFLSLKEEISATPFAHFSPLLDEMAHLDEDGIIHGDLFCDNALFEDERLSGVIDFIEAAHGSFAFDLGVAAFSFCSSHGVMEEPKLRAMAAAYDARRYCDKELLRFAIYGALFYGLGRYTKKRNWRVCLTFLQNYA